MLSIHVNTCSNATALVHHNSGHLLTSLMVCSHRTQIEHQIAYKTPRQLTFIYIQHPFTHSLSGLISTWHTDSPMLSICHLPDIHWTFITLDIVCLLQSSTLPCDSPSACETETLIILQSSFHLIINCLNTHYISVCFCNPVNKHYFTYHLSDSWCIRDNVFNLLFVNIIYLL